MMSRTFVLLAGLAVAIANPSPADAQGTAQLASPPSGSLATRTLVCHGGPGIQVRVHADPSPSWRGPASFPAKPVRMALQFTGGASIARLADAERLPAGSCAWIAWDGGLGAAPGEVYVDVNPAGRPAPNSSSIGADLADAKRFFLFPTQLVGGGPLASFRGEWIPGAPSQAAGPSIERATVAASLRQLMCRGGPSGFEFRVIAKPSPAYANNPRYVRLAMRYPVYAPSDTAEFRLGSMSPGSCGWDMRFGALKPPGEVIIDIDTDAQAANAGLGIPRDTSLRAGLSYLDTASFRRYLSEPGNFWIFYHMHPGEPLAMSHGAHQPDLTNLVAGSRADARTTASGTRFATPPVAPAPAPAPAPPPPPPGSGPGDARTSRTVLPDVRIWGVATAPGPRGVWLVFDTDRPTAFSTRGIGVEFGSQRPPWDEERRRWAYRPASTGPIYAEISHPAHGGYLAQPARILEQRQRYYYLITVESRDASLPPRQEVGSFIAASNPFTTSPPAPGPDPAAKVEVGQPLRGEAREVAGTLRDQAPGAASAEGTTARPAGSEAAQPSGPGTSRTPLPPDVRIWDVRTRRGTNGVTLSFRTDQAVARRGNGGVRVQFSDRQPGWENGLLTSPAVESRAREVASGLFRAVPYQTLQAGRRYYYLITVASNDETLRPRQATGSFVPDFGR